MILRKSVHRNPKHPPCERVFLYSFDGGKTWVDHAEYMRYCKKVTQVVDYYDLYLPAATS